MRKVCLFYSQNDEIVSLSKMADTFFENSLGAQRFVGCFLDFAFRMLIGWAGKLRSHGCHVHIPSRYVFVCVCFFFFRSRFNGSWSKKGCHLQNTTRSESFLLSNHLTSFAVLFQVRKTEVLFYV